MNLMRRGHHLIMKLRWQEIRHHALKVVATPTIATPSRDVIIRLAELNVAKKITNPKNLPGFQLGIDSQKKKQILFLLHCQRLLLHCKILQSYTDFTCHCTLVSYYVCFYTRLNYLQLYS